MNARDLAKKLTTAQKKRLLNIYELNQRQLLWASQFGNVSLRTSRATSRALSDMRLICAAPLTDHAVLTALGLDVRRHIVLQENAR